MLDWHGRMFAMISIILAIFFWFFIALFGFWQGFVLGDLPMWWIRLWVIVFVGVSSDWAWGGWAVMIKFVYETTWSLIKNKLYESSRRKPGWRCTAGVQFFILGDVLCIRFANWYFSHQVWVNWWAYAKRELLGKAKWSKHRQLKIKILVTHECHHKRIS